METALKSNYRKEMAIKLTPQTFTEEFSVQNCTNCDDFFVDDLLDFSQVEEEPEQQQKEHQDTVCVSPQQSHEPSTFKHDYDYVSVPTTDLTLPTDDVADLEWLSHFVEDSFSEFSASFKQNPTGSVVKEQKQEPEPESPVFSFKTPVQTKARSKRIRNNNGVRIWPVGSPSFTDSSISSNSTTTTTTTSSSSSSSPSSPLLVYTNFPQSLQPKPKKPKNKTSSDTAATLAPRRCSHCGVQKTPQWRTGPLGPKTLCNACGVRFKSGRLLPEYRPACSPTFSNELHSNHHRKVLEMRRKKEIGSGVESDLIPSPIVPTF